MTVGGEARSHGLHYGWVILVVATLTIMGCIGFARFGYTMILPPMQAALGLSNTQTGGLATGNFVGYLVLAVVGGYIASRYGPRRVIGISMLLTGVTMVLTGLANSFGGALVWRVLTGVGTGGSNIPVMGLLSAWFASRRRGLATGVAMAGASLAMMVTGPLVSRTLDRFGENGWRYGWFILGAFVLLLGLLAAALLRNRPEENGLRPVAADADESVAQVVRSVSPHTARTSLRQTRGTSSLDWGRVYRAKAVWHLALVYIAFGFSYIIYVTYFAKYLQAEAGYTRKAAGNLWAIVGWISIFCGLIWGSVSDRVGRKFGLALVYVLQAIAFVAFALWRSPTGYAISAIIFGLTACSSPNNFPDTKERLFTGNYATGNFQFSGSIKVVSWNCNFGEQLDQIISVLLENEALKNADVLLLQELNEANVDLLALALRYNYVYYPATIHPHNGKNFGNAILSPWPLSGPEKILLPNTQPDYKQDRIAVRSKVLIAGSELAAYSVHLEHLWMLFGRDDSQVDVLVRQVGKEDGLVIVGGDFNSWSPGSIDTLDKQFKEIGLRRVSKGADPTLIATGGVPLTVDHIFASDMFISQAGVWNDFEISDHAAVWALLGFQEPE